MDYTHKKIWYLPDQNTWKDFNLLAMRDSGTLTIYNQSLVFEGKKTKITIKNIKSVSFGKQGRDFINNWVNVEFLDENGEGSNAFFADGKLIGWSGIFGGTKKLYDSIKKLEGK